MIRVHKPISNYCPLGKWECEKMYGIRNWLWSSRAKDGHSWMASKSKRAHREEWKSKTEIRYECEKKASERKLESRSSCTDTRESNTHTFSIFASAISFLFDSARRNQLIAISCTPFSNFIRTNIVCSSSLQSQFTYLFVWHFYLHLVLVFRWHLICHSLNGLSVLWRIKLHQLPEHIRPHIDTHRHKRIYPRHRVWSLGQWWKYPKYWRQHSEWNWCAFLCVCVNVRNGDCGLWNVVDLNGWIHLCDLIEDGWKLNIRLFVIANTLYYKHIAKLTPGPEVLNTHIHLVSSQYDNWWWLKKRTVNDIISTNRSRILLLFIRVTNKCAPLSLSASACNVNGARVWLLSNSGPFGSPQTFWNQQETLIHLPIDNVFPYIPWAYELTVPINGRNHKFLYSYSYAIIKVQMKNNGWKKLTKTVIIVGVRFRWIITIHRCEKVCCTCSS